MTTRQACYSITSSARDSNDVPDCTTQGNLRPYFSKPKGSSTEWAGWVNQRAPVSVMTM
jgi:hypothetical protein